MTIAELMDRHDIERIVFVPSDSPYRASTFHAWPFNSWLTDHCGIGATIEEAIEDAVQRRDSVRKEAA